MSGGAGKEDGLRNFIRWGWGRPKKIKKEENQFGFSCTYRLVDSSKGRERKKEKREDLTKKGGTEATE